MAGNFNLILSSAISADLIEDYKQTLLLLSTASVLIIWSIQRTADRQPRYGCRLASLEWKVVWAIPPEFEAISAIRPPHPINEI